MRLKRGVFRRRERSVPGLNTAALPDLIFTVLFFFMIVTHMRDVEPLVSCDVPCGKEVERLGHKSAVAHIYVGRPASLTPPPSAATPGAVMRGDGRTVKDTFCIQLNNRLATVADIREYIDGERERMSPDDRTHMVVNLKADRDVPMSLVADIKQALRQSFALRISYAATEQGEAGR